MTHTKTTWRIATNSRFVGKDARAIKETAIKHGRHRTIAIMAEPGGEPYSANAHLIAAAPELLSACTALLEFWDNGTPVYPGSLVVDDVRSAIARAAGN